MYDTVMKKRRKASSDVHTEDSLDHESFKLELEMDELPDLTPVKSVLDHSSNDARSPPEIGPAVRSYSAQQIESQAAGKDSSAALTQEVTGECWDSLSFFLELNKSLWSGSLLV